MSGSDIKYFTIYGERCSGTNFLESSIVNNFKMQPTWEYGWKHFFGHYKFDMNDKNPNSRFNQTLFIGIIREPVSWLDSLYKQPHHIPHHNRISPEALLLNEHYSTVDNYSSIEEMKDRNFITKKRYKNIFELRKVKNDFLIYFMPGHVKNYIFIRYEDLKNHYDFILSDIQQKFNLQKLNIDKPYTRIIKYKGKQNMENYKENKIEFSEKTINLINNNLDNEQEKKLGYIS